MKTSGFILEIPGGITIKAENLVLDYNGTLALDGILLKGVSDKLIQLASIFKIHVVTADTFGTVADQLRELPLQIIIISDKDQAEQKLRHLEKLGRTETITVGNGRNDIQMLEKAALGIGIIQAEGCYSAITRTADLIYTDINNALDSLLHPNRIIAALRN